MKKEKKKSFPYWLIILILILLVVVLVSIFVSEKKECLGEGEYVVGSDLSCCDGLYVDGESSTCMRKNAGSSSSGGPL